MTRLLLALYRLGLRAFPRRFRNVHGPGMEETFADVLARARGRGGAPRALATAVAEIASVTTAGLRERVHRSRSRGSESVEPKSGANGSALGSAGNTGVLLQDVRYALRALRRRPAFTTGVLLTLALGIGANAAIFTMVDSVLLRPLPFPEPERLVRVWSVPDGGGERWGVSVPDAADWNRLSGATSAIGLYSTLPSDLVVRTDAGAEELETATVTAGFFAALGVPAALGRTLIEDDERTDPRVVVLSHRLWTDRFGADSARVGRTLVLDDLPYRVIGVMPPDFGFPSGSIDVWSPLAAVPLSDIPHDLRGLRLFNAVARLEAGVDVDAAAERLTAAVRALAREYPESNDVLSGAAVAPLRRSMVAEARPVLLVLFGTVGLVLLMATANVANLLLSRAQDRTTEMSVRAALGAGRARLVRQVLTEGLVLSAAGAALGVLLARIALATTLGRVAPLLPRTGEIALDGPVLAFTVALAVLTGLVFSLPPALRVAVPGRPGGDRTVVGNRPGRLRAALVTTQVALALVLLVGAGLTTRSLARLADVDPGFEPERALGMTLTVQDTRYPERADYLGFQRDLLERLSALPGVDGVGALRALPLRGGGEGWSYAIPGEPLADGLPPQALTVQVTPGTLGVLGARFLAGRDIAPADAAGPMVVVANEAFAREAFGGARALGRTVRLNDLEARIVGIVADIHHEALREAPGPTIYLPQQHVPRRGMGVVVRTAGDPLELAGAVRLAVAELDPGQAITELVPLDRVVDDALEGPRLVALLLGAFAGLALLLAAMGTYAVISYQISARVREIGIRSALGASASRTVRGVLVPAMVPVAVGIAVGLVVAAALTRSLEALLFGIAALDPPTYAAVTAALLAVALVAAAGPAVRAARIDPACTMRDA